MLIYVQSWKDPLPKFSRHFLLKLKEDFLQSIQESKIKTIILLEWVRWVKLLIFVLTDILEW